MTKKILLVDDYNIMKLVLSSIFKQDSSFELIAYANTREKAISAIQTLYPDIVIIDVSLKDGNGIGLCEEIVSRFKIKVIVLTTITDDDLILDAAKAGVSGYLLKDIDSKKLLNCLKHISDGRNLFDNRISKNIKKVLTRDYAFEQGA